MTTREEYEQRRMEVADELIEHPENFDMLVWGRRTECGTVACIAGTAALVAAKQGHCTPFWQRMSPTMHDLRFVSLPRAEPYPVQAVRSFAAEYLGLPEETNLFVRFELTNEEAAKELLSAPYVEER